MARAKGPGLPRALRFLFEAKNKLGDTKTIGVTVATGLDSPE